MPGVFCLVGPTAVGKSALAVEVAEGCGAEILNADAFQIYRGLEILSAKPHPELRRRVPHHLLGAVSLDEEMSAVKFRDLAAPALSDVRSRGKSALVVSGSGLYVKALTHGLSDAPPPQPELRRELEQLPLIEAVKRLCETAPERAARTDLKNPRRVTRALEIAASIIPSGRGIARDDGARGALLMRDRDDLYRRIDERVKAMFRDGVQEEVRAISHAGPTARRALGFDKIQRLLAGEITESDCIAQIQQATRHYARRQLTWFRHQTNFPQLNLTTLSHQEAVSAILQMIAQE